MKAILIDVAAMRVARITLPDDEPRLFAAIRERIGCTALALGALLPKNDVLFFNPLAMFEEELYFKHVGTDTPIAGNGIVLGSVPGTGEPCSVQSHLASMRASLIFMDKWDTIEWAMRRNDSAARAMVA